MADIFDLTLYHIPGSASASWNCEGSSFSFIWRLDGNHRENFLLILYSGKNESNLTNFMLLEGDTSVVKDNEKATKDIILLKVKSQIISHIDKKFNEFSIVKETANLPRNSVDFSLYITNNGDKNKLDLSTLQYSQYFHHSSIEL